MNAHGARQDVIIVGAARSGTNILRNVLCRLPGFETWPCDEINFIWRYGNASLPHDELSPSHARPEVKEFICGAFRRMARRSRARFLVEKTCANSLRLGFVDRVNPDARYVAIVRDGRDVVPSAMKRWYASLDPLYVARKARFVPLRDVPCYAVRFLRNRLSRVLSSERRLATWGPRFRGMDEVLESRGLAVTCAVQWRRSVEQSISILDGMPTDRVHHIRYEEFVEDPVGTLVELTDALGVSLDEVGAREVTADVWRHSVGKGREWLDRDIADDIRPIMAPTLARLGYTVR